MTTNKLPHLNFGHWLDSLTIAIKNLEADAKTQGAARHLAASIRASSRLRELVTLTESARQVEESPAKDLIPRLRELVALMRAEASRQQNALPSLLIVTTDNELLNGLRRLFEERGRIVAICKTADEAIFFLHHNDMSAVIVDLILPDHDGRWLISTLRSNPATAALPVVAVGPFPPRLENDAGLVHEADLYFEKPIIAVNVVDGLALLLKRVQERGRKARRDTITGLLNRAAFSETYDQVAADCVQAHEPLALAIFGVHRFDEMAKERGVSSLDDMIRQVGATLSASFRATDIVARWGLAEFAVILPGEDHYGATRALEKAMGALNRLTLSTSTDKRHHFCAGLAVLSEKTPIANAVGEAERHLFESYSTCLGSKGGQIVASDVSQTVRRSEHIAICIADGNMGRALRQMLERDHFSIEVFSTADEAVAGLALNRYHLLIADDAIALKGDVHLIERIRAIPLCSRLRVIMLVSSEASIVQALELGANDYAIKPPDVMSFMSRVRRMLARGKAFSSRITVMIVDHEIPQLLVAGTTLYQQCGCRVLLAYGVEDALRRLASIVPDYLILDMDIPNVSGQEFLAKLPHFADVEIIPASATSSQTGNLQSDTFQISGRLTRPYKPGTLIEEFRGIVPRPTENIHPGETNGDSIESEIRRILTLRH